MIAPFPIVTTDLSGKTRRFEVTFETDDSRPEELYVKALEVGADPTEIEGFQVTLVPFSTGDHRIDSITAHPSHRKAGIPDVLIPALAEKLGGRIVSSTNSMSRSSDSEWHSVDARKMWERLVAKGLASYDATRDRFSCPP